MKLANANKIREKEILSLLNFYEGEDADLIASNKINLPIVSEDGEEGWLEVTVTITKDEGDDGYLKREAYKIKVAEKEARAKALAEKKAKKIASDTKRREELKAKAQAE